MLEYMPIEITSHATNDKLIITEKTGHEIIIKSKYISFTYPHVHTHASTPSCHVPKYTLYMYAHTHIYTHKDTTTYTCNIPSLDNFISFFVF